MKKTIIFLIKRLLYTGVITLLFLLFSCSEPKENISSKSTNLIPPPVPDQNINVSEITKYGIYKIQSNNHVFTIENNGGKPLEINAVLITGTNPAEFINNSTLPFTIQPGDTGVINIECKPKVTGNKEIKIIICSNDPDNKFYIFTVKAKADWVVKSTSNFYYNNGFSEIFQTPTANCIRADIELIGGGGGGASGDEDDGRHAHGGGGGGAGEILSRTNFELISSSNYSIYIGKGGARVSHNRNDGKDGENSYISLNGNIILTARHGFGGLSRYILGSNGGIGYPSGSNGKNSTSDPDGGSGGNNGKNGQGSGGDGKDNQGRNADPGGDAAANTGCGGGGGGSTKDNRNDGGDGGAGGSGYCQIICSVVECVPF